MRKRYLALFIAGMMALEWIPVYAGETGSGIDPSEKKRLMEDAGESAGNSLEGFCALLDEEELEAIEREIGAPVLDDREIKREDKLSIAQRIMLHWPEEDRLAEIPELPAKQQREPDRGGEAGVSDVVEIDGLEYAVLTPEGIGIAYRAESEEICVFTQDYAQQAQLYQQYYENPISAVAGMMDNGRHLNVYDPESGVDLYLTVSEGSWEKDYPDSARLEEAEVQSILQYLEGCGFSDAAMKTFGAAGGNSYFLFDCSETEGFVVMYASVGGVSVRVHYYASSYEQVVRGLELMEGMTVRAL